MKAALRFSVLLCVCATLLCAASVGGIWKGAFDFNGQSVPLVFNLSASGDAVTGNIEGLLSSPTAIHDGKVDGDTVTVWINTEYQGQTYKLVYKGKVSDDAIQFTFGTEDGSWGSQVTAKKSS